MSQSIAITQASLKANPRLKARLVSGTPQVEIYWHPGKFKFLDAPLLSPGPYIQCTRAAYIPAALADKFFIRQRSVAKMVNTRQLEKFFLRTDDPNFVPYGDFLLLSDVRQAQHSAKSTTNTKLVNQLCQRWPRLSRSKIQHCCSAQLNAEQKTQAVEILARLENQELALTSHTWIIKSPIYKTLLNFLTKNSVVKVCPVTGKRYMPAAYTMDQLARLPGFSDILSDTLGKDFSVKLINSDAAKAAILSAAL